jgi:hypothetical protein
MIHTSDDMARQLPSWAKIIIASALSLFAGFGAGTWITFSERTALKTEVAFLKGEQESIRRDMSDIEARNTRMAAILAETNSRLSERDQTISQLTARFSQLQNVQGAPPTAPTTNPGMQSEQSLETSSTKDQAIAALQGEIAALKKRLADTEAGGGAPLPDTRPVQPSRASVGEASQSKGQCTATTKKGTRCSRTARSNGRCWQHGG